ncbi:HvfC family RiPP maturation protein [Vulcaniibacterium tengchongense]|uniref:Uncharacterized protein n=1 Tax=Vulcaniibacterium tengchongense TaxID=1273429 RepID=A0A3N4VT95_9GAMM|nr:putative DNA-binding domain-containing protein [Vulcaniibacterium tengchongense]RPE77030.1 hypothetical protein EDC50_2283 [Vulcaniibacterium tengchongense]
MPDAPERLRAQQLELTRHLRDPANAPAPAGVEERRLAVYRELLFNNIEGLLAGNFPVIRRLLGEEWPALARAFYRDHRCRTPLFPEIAREFLRYLEGREDLRPPFLAELAHYEWVELALQIAEAAPPRDGACDPLEGVPRRSPLAWPLAYRWPVHRIGPDYRPDAPPQAPTLLLARRQADGAVRFSELSPLAFRLLERLDQAPASSGREQLLALAREAGIEAGAGYLAQGSALLRQMREAGVIAYAPA